MKRILFYFLASLVIILLSQPHPASARMYLDITQAQIQKLPFAIPPFLKKTDPGQPEKIGSEMAAYLSTALTMHGFITIVEEATGITNHEHDWHGLGAAYAVLGAYEITQDGIVLELRLIDAYKNILEYSRRYQGPDGNYRPILLKFCDDVILQLTGEAGISQSQFAFVSNSTGSKEIYLANALGDEIRQVTRHNNLALSPRLSRDGTRLAYTSYHGGNPNLYVTDLSQDKNTTLISRRKGLNMAPAWAPDGNSMVITLSKDGNPDLYLISTAGKIIKRLTNGEGINVSPSFAPDGHQIAFVSDRSGNPQIYVMDLTTGNTRRVTYNGSYNTTPDWSPKGDMIAYSGREEGNFHIFTIRPDGSNNLRITNDPSDHESPAWSPDSRQIAFSQKSKNNQRICVVFRNGSGRRTLFTQLKGEQSMPQWSIRRRS